MARQPTHDENDDRTSGQAPAGDHDRLHDDVTEGGPAEAPKAEKGMMKASTSNAVAEHAVAGDDTSRATAGTAEKEQAARAGAEKTQSGRGHRKHED